MQISVNSSTPHKHEWGVSKSFQPYYPCYRSRCSQKHVEKSNQKFHGEIRVETCTCGAERYVYLKYPRKGEELEGVASYNTWKSGGKEILPEERFRSRNALEKCKAYIQEYAPKAPLLSDGVARAYAWLGEQKKAREFFLIAAGRDRQGYERNMESGRRLGVGDFAHSLNHIGWCYGRAGDQEKMISFLRKALEHIEGDLEGYPVVNTTFQEVTIGGEMKERVRVKIDGPEFIEVESGVDVSEDVRKVVSALNERRSIRWKDQISYGTAELYGHRAFALLFTGNSIGAIESGQKASEIVMRAWQAKGQLYSDRYLWLVHLAEAFREDDLDSLDTAIAAMKLFLLPRAKDYKPWSSYTFEWDLYILTRRIRGEFIEGKRANLQFQPMDLVC